MQLILIVLSRVECLEDLLTRFAEDGITGATVLESTGMAKVLSHHEDSPMFGLMRLMFDPDREESKTIFTVLPEEMVDVLKKGFAEVVGDINKPNTGVIIGLPVSFIDGIGGFSSGK